VWFPASGAIGGWGMRKLDCDRRKILRLTVFGATLGWALDPASSHPVERRAAPKRRLPTVVIDPGHGGIDPGATGPSGVYEKDIVLSTARDFARQLAATRRCRIVLTRRVDKFIPLRDPVRARPRLASGPVSVAPCRCAAGQGNARVVNIHIVCSGVRSGSCRARISENKADLAGINLTRQPREVGTILMDLVRRQTSNLSIVLARSVVDQLARELVLLEPSQRSADFAVLTAPDIPSVLIELGCLSNPKEVRLLKQRGYQQKLARGLVRAVLAYFAAPAAS